MTWGKIPELSITGRRAETEVEGVDYSFRLMLTMVRQRESGSMVVP